MVKEMLGVVELQLMAVAVAAVVQVALVAMALLMLAVQEAQHLRITTQLAVFLILEAVAEAVVVLLVQVEQMLVLAEQITATQHLELPIVVAAVEVVTSMDFLAQVVRGAS